jgi:hypothetical protein
MSAMTPEFLPQSLRNDIADLPQASNDEIQDGIQLQHRWIPLTNGYDSLCVDQLRDLRLANGFRPYHLPVPALAVNLSNYDTYQRQFSVPAGSWLLGFVTANGEIASLSRRVTIKDACTDQPLFSDWVGAGTMYTGIETPLGFSPLPAPRLIGDPGTIVVEISLISDSASLFYLVLLFATPVVSLPVRRYTAPGGIR